MQESEKKNEELVFSSTKILDSPKIDDPDVSYYITVTSTEPNIPNT
jgi:hypothetical protein